MKTLIIGGGLSGLALAERLETAGQAYHLLEARGRFGGRIVTERVEGAYFDLGPAWFWPGQTRIDAMVQRLGLTKFDQYATGALVFEDETGRVQKGAGMASMEGSWRLEGGLARLTEALAEHLPYACVDSNAPVLGLTWTDTGIGAVLPGGRVVEADRVVLALPPRLAAEVSFTPALPSDATQAMAAVPTWMAGQAKAVAVYDQAFWRAAGLSGDAISRRGPMVEIHDASPKTGGPDALFGFIGVPAAARADEAALREAILAQFVRLFGAEAASPRALFLKDWATDPFTATPADAAPLYAHPSYGVPRTLDHLWEGRIIFAGTEVAPSFGGYIEGALEAADAAFARLMGDAPIFR